MPPFLPMQDPVAVSAEGDALLLRLADGFVHVTVPCDEVVDGSFVLPDDMVKVDDGGMGEPAMGADLLCAIGLPTRLFTLFAFVGISQDFGSVGEIPAPRIFSLPFTLDLLVLVRHLKLSFPI